MKFNNELTEKRFNKLPEYARNALKSAHNELERLRSIVNNILNEVEGNSKIRCELGIWNSSESDRFLNLPNRPITFDLTEEGSPQDSVSIQFHHQFPNALYLSADFGTLEITPWASNVILIRTKKER